MKRIDWALIFLSGIVFLIALLVAFSGSAAASWDQPQVALSPGTWQVIEFTNSENAPENLTVANISAPDVLLPYVVVSPTSVPPSSAENVTIQFAYVPVSVRQSVPHDIFSVQVNGMIVYLDLSVPLPENAENRWAELEARIDALRASFAEQMEDLAVRLTVLESAEHENWMPEFEALWDNLIRLGDWTTSKIMELWASAPENSPPADMMLWQTMLDDVENELRTEYEQASNQLRQDYEAQIAKTNAENELLRLEVFGAIAGAVIAIVIAIRRPKLTKPSLKLHQKKFEEIPLDDKIAMLENEIDAMRERGDPDDSIKEKERELWELRKQLKPKKKRGK